MIYSKIMKYVSVEMIYAFVGTFVMGALGHLYIFTHNFTNWDGIYYFWTESLGMVELGRWLLGGYCH